jgi:hypothetical protein
LHEGINLIHQAACYFLNVKLFLLAVSFLTQGPGTYRPNIEFTTELPAWALKISQGLIFNVSRSGTNIPSGMMGVPLASDSRTARAPALIPCFQDSRFPRENQNNFALSQYLACQFEGCFAVVGGQEYDRNESGFGRNRLSCAMTVTRSSRIRGIWSSSDTLG